MTYGKPPTVAQLDKLIDILNAAREANNAYDDATVSGPVSPEADAAVEASHELCHRVEQLIESYLRPRVQGLVE